MHIRKWQLENSLGIIVFYLRKNKLCVPEYSLRHLLVREAYWSGLMGHFGISITLGVLHKHLFWPHMKRDVERIYDKCVTYSQAKYGVKHRGLYTPLLISNEP